MKKNVRSKVKVPNEGPVMACLSIFKSNLHHYTIFIEYVVSINKIIVVCYVLKTDLMGMTTMTTIFLHTVACKII